MAFNNWDDLSGEATARGLGDIRNWRVDKFCSFVWWYATHDRETKDVEMFRNRIWQPPKGDDTPIPKQSPWSAESEAESFASFKSQLQQ